MEPMPQSWPGLQGHSTHDSELSPPISPQSGQAAIEAALGRLELGQVLNRKAGEHRVEMLVRHVDTRLSDLRHDLGGRMDRLESRVGQVEARTMTGGWTPTQTPTPSTGAPAGRPEPPVDQTAAASRPSPATAPGEQSLATWMQALSPREWILWLLLLAWAFGLIPESVARVVLERLLPMP